MKVLFNCNVSASGGAGHLIRSIAIAEQAKIAGIDVAFGGRFSGDFAHAALSARGFRVLPLDDTNSGIAKMAKQIGADLVHCDDYTAGPQLHEVLREIGVHLSNVEDGSFGARPADIVIDPTPGAEKHFRAGLSSANHLRGIAYLPLRASVLDAALARRSRKLQDSSNDEGRFKILVILGGTDAAGATEYLAQLWCSAVPDSTCYAVVPTIPVRSQAPKSADIRWVLPSEDVVSLFSHIDAVITASGTTVWELAAVGVPAAVIVQAENQRENYNQLAISDAMIGLGSVSNMRQDPESLRLKFKDLLARASSDRVPAYDVDVDGARRIVASWWDVMLSEDVVRVREARPSDASVLFEWRNDESVRKVSGDTRPLQWERHVAWLNSVLHNPERILLIAESGPELIGTVRVDRVEGNKSDWELSIALNPSFRGRGLGGQMLRTAETHLRRQLPNDTVLIAHVRPDNTPSNRLFMMNDYKRDAGADPLGYFRWCKRIV
ncbi:bifunctional UDP-2,4-diacetamido-2,4,6-trideoxy-beta-L-altropyranose hydrolase/GNAT family N-acetyltransferase [Pseudarthrobacter sp. NIBRBAC000502771]|uniref:bifunctional UDP-2,4-diacetamido-2,4,6-trideoxy-beta-L-altropyranose hydrolase/GNAT family N-acetyltransferase n=1 Tax=Pseudarthrobacter sp. NIBRBAC000502771 TaxID=2590774 RepID=UPI00113132F1|nr:bifunctional UDP-2,4-diacetamido-2,4,6-trideoxy-beta-L-altropyranose hydrolase/GNAT family N-acetyltransferase [Pseudarthrobacter sp. NIBRBAC000502771]QDG62551.1 UDP-2,4-diacetamido-2,4,6-trideoxy-beta-L-altropyranose hydrolase [Pseudarthrobacter sp. NIBRBAC000502771]